MGNDLSIWTLVLDASVIVQAVMVLLMVASIASWAVIFKKSRVISHSRRQADEFETAFWSGGDLTTLYRNIETKGRAGTGLQSIFESGFGEFSRLRQLGTPFDQLLEGARRAMRVAQMRELDRLERNLATLATVGSTSPYVGLFGTVWGIMTAFHNLGNVHQATLAAGAAGAAGGVGAGSPQPPPPPPYRFVPSHPRRDCLQPVRGSGEPAGTSLRH